MTKQELINKMQEGQAWIPGKRVKIDFGDDGGSTTDKLAQIGHVGSALHERKCDPIHVQSERKFKVAPILFCQCGIGIMLPGRLTPLRSDN